MRYTLVKHLGVLSESDDNNGNPMTKEVNLISWDGKIPVLDVRSWSADHNTMTSGTTFTQKELTALIKAVKAWSEQNAKGVE